MIVLGQIDILARGEGVVAQNGREAHLRPGDLTFVDLARPTDWRMSEMQVVSVSFPRAVLPLPRDDLVRLGAVTIPGDRGTGSLISSLALGLPGHLDEPGAEHGTRLGTAVLDPLTAETGQRGAFQPGVPQRVRPGARRVPPSAPRAMN